MAQLAVPVVAMVLAGTASPSFAQEDAFERGVERFRARDFAAAANELERAHAADPRDEDASLLLGISYYQLGRPGAAEPLLRDAAASTDAEVAGSANVFLGLIADERGDADAARKRLSAAASSSNPSLAAAGRSLLGATTPDRAVLVFLAAPGVDSNVPLLPATVMPGITGAAADAYLALVAAGQLQLARGWTLEDTASYRVNARLHDYDLFANLAALRYDWRGTRNHLTVGGGFEAMTLGREMYATGGLGQASWRTRIAGSLGIDAGYTLSDRTYYPDGYAPYTGPVHTGITGLDLAERVTLSYVILRELTSDPEFVALGQGAKLSAQAPLGRHADGALTAWAIARSFDNVDRKDTQLYADASLVFDLSEHVGFVLGASVLRNISSDADYDYVKVTAHAGLDFGLGVK